MSSFEPNKHHLRGTFDLLLQFEEICSRKAALSESCREWLQKFKNGEFDIEDKENSGRLKVYEDVELEASLNQDSCQTPEEQLYIFKYMLSDNQGNYTS